MSLCLLARPLGPRYLPGEVKTNGPLAGQGNSSRALASHCGFIADDGLTG